MLGAREYYYQAVPDLRVGKFLRVRLVGMIDAVELTHTLLTRSDELQLQTPGVASCSSTAKRCCGEFVVAAVHSDV